MRHPILSFLALTVVGIVLTILWLFAQLLHYALLIIAVIFIWGFWDVLRGKPTEARKKQ